MQTQTHMRLRGLPSFTWLLVLVPLAGGLVGGCTCGDSSSAPGASASSASAATAPVHPKISRDDFNRLAVHLNQPIFWAADANKSGTIDPGEVKTLLFYPTEPRWVDG